MAEEGLEDRALLPSGDESILLVGVLDGRDDGLAGVAPEVTFDQRVEAGDGAQDSTPGRGTLLVGVEGGPVALLGPAALGWAQVEAGLVMLLTDAALGLPIVAGLVVDMAEITTGRVT